MNDRAGADSEKPRERYGDSYLAMDASQKKPVVAKTVKRRSGGKIRALLWGLLACGVFAYFQRARLFSWLESDPRTAAAVEVLRERFGGRKGAGSFEGGETTFSLGQGSGTVMPDDGADTFRVIQPPEPGTPP